MTTEMLTTFAASRTIIKQSGLCKVETGGVLVGTLEPLTIVAAGSPGPNATHRPAQFTSDPAADQACLTEARRQYGEQITVCGWWHKHPAGLTTPSGGDCHQARQLMNEYADGQPVLIGIVNHEPRLTRNRTTLHVYSIDRAGTFTEQPWKLVGSKDGRLLDAMKKAPRRPDLKPTDYWRDKDFQSYLNPLGRDRINREIRQLREAGWNVETGRRTVDQSLVLNLRSGSTALRLLLPPEFPLNPPVALTAEGERLVKLLTSWGWNSQSCLLDVAVEAADILRCARCRTRCVARQEVSQ